MNNLHQSTIVTNYNRYPNIFLKLSELKKDADKILSFGCSIGAETQTLKELYFKNSNIYGVDINIDAIKKAKNKYKDNNFFLYDTNEHKQHKYDIIFAMSVLCRWPETEKVLSSKGIYEFEKYNDMINELDSLLNINGYLVIYNANYLFSDSDIFSKYEIITDTTINESGFVHKFNKQNEKLSYNNNEVIFKKLI